MMKNKFLRLLEALLVLDSSLDVWVIGLTF